MVVKRQIIGFKTGYLSSPTNPGDQWRWGRRIDSAGSGANKSRNGGFWKVLNSSFNDLHGESWMDCMIKKSYTGHDSVLYTWKVDVDWKHPGHYEDGSDKLWTVSDPKGWQYQVKIKNMEDFEANLENILYFESDGKRKTPYSWVWVSYADDKSDYDYVKDNAYHPVAEEEDNAWWAMLVKSSKTTSQCKFARKGRGNPAWLETSRLRNVVGFTMNCMVKGSKDAYMYPSSIGMIMNKGNSAMRVAFPHADYGNSMMLTQNIVGSTYWNDGTRNEVLGTFWKADDVKAKVLELNYYCDADSIREIVSNKWEFMGLWWQFTTQNTSGAGYGWKAMGYWNFRPIVCGPDGTVGTTWNSNSYNILGNQRSYGSEPSIYMV